MNGFSGYHCDFLTQHYTIQKGTCSYLVESKFLSDILAMDADLKKTDGLLWNLEQK